LIRNQSNKFNNVSLSELEKLSSNIISEIYKGCIITLSGPLGAGKTTFARYLIQSILGVNAEVTSPTFNIIQIYENLNFNIYHMDFYRLSSEEKNLELDLDEAFQEGVSIIEWPERLAKLIPKKNRIDIIINHINSSDCLRNIEIVSNLKIK
tara:strand:- start:48 stop:503 length:456 start_codon:yes stop_codon:yes gene_type:complete